MRRGGKRTLVEGSTWETVLITAEGARVEEDWEEEADAGVCPFKAKDTGSGGDARADGTGERL